MRVRSKEYVGLLENELGRLDGELAGYRRLLWKHLVMMQVLLVKRKRRVARCACLLLLPVASHWSTRGASLFDFCAHLAKSRAEHRQTLMPLSIAIVFGGWRRQRRKHYCTATVDKNRTAPEFHFLFSGNDSQRDVCRVPVSRANGMQQQRRFLSIQTYSMELNAKCIGCTIVSSY